MSTLKTWAEKLVTPVLSPTQFDFWAQQFGSTRAWTRCYAKVTSITTEGRNTKTLTLKANRNWPGFIAGQHINVTAMIAGRNITRSYSISNDPIDGRRIQITVRCEANGVMSEYLCRQVKVGDQLELGKPFGEMILTAPLPNHLLLLAAGSGITPMMSQIRMLARTGMPSLVTLVYWEKTVEDFNFKLELQSIASQYSHFNVYFITTRSQTKSDVSGRVSQALLNQISQIDTVDKAFACGASGFVDAVAHLFELKQLTLVSEAFTPPSSQSAPAEVAQFDVFLSRQNKKLRINNQQPLLEQLENAGVSVQSGCRQGICNTCTCKRDYGTTMDTFSGITDCEPSHLIKLCVTRATSNIQLDL